MLESYRPLIRLWAAVLSSAAVGMATLQILGPPPSPTAAEQPDAAASPPPAAASTAPPPAPASLPTAAAEPPAPAPSALAVPEQPSRRRTRSWVRRGASPARAPPGGQDAGSDGFLAERSQRGPLPQERDTPPPPAAPNPPPRSSAYQHVAGYIGIFTTGADGTRVFKATP